ncbi:2-oxoacid:acceptor oxidoreductase subunit alpha [Alicyclobacillus sp. SO9]|uniref:2-oxoacid:acceptor oxidoreductase subunit alpha n=1 Tax=Alicyclobacillus sp. SO9 TaxID=2665646 RepID=UPI001E3ABF8B|nr:2-oxoacid:acceptor oxidoreductase subunit alpha [Alicyclobacillus sp. SO9]
MDSLEWKVGGQQGEGVDSTGEIFAKMLFRHGHYVTTYKQFMSRIKGGHTNYKIRATSYSTHHAGDGLDILLALDDDSYKVNKHELNNGALVLFDGEVSIEKTEGHTLVHLPLKQIAKDIGNPLAKNMIALGVSGALVSLPQEEFFALIEDQFAKKGTKIIEANKTAVEKGYELVAEHLSDSVRHLNAPDAEKRMLISANQAVAFGSLMAGCRFLSAYPITPASEIMEWLSHELPKVGGTIMQVEDEIAGITFAIGASFAGARSMTSTSGPGLSLKTEALGMAGMSETPIVIVDSQRAGPSTGLPTKFEQSDLQHVLHASHGEFPRIVLYPSTIEDSFYLAAEAFNMAENYQCPVFLLLDLGMSMNKSTIMPIDAKRVAVNRGKVLTESDLEQLKENFQRYQFSSDGISPRAIPGTPGGVHVTSSNEHAESGYITEEPDIRTKIMEKRMRKIENATCQNPFYVSNPEADTMVVTMGSTRGAVEEAIRAMSSEGASLGQLNIQQLHPLPTDALRPYLADKKVIVVESNYEGQLLNWLKQHLPIHDRSYSIRQYDGNPFRVDTIASQLKELV